MKAVKYFLFLPVIFCACNNSMDVQGPVSTPQKLIQEKKFVNLLYEMQLLEGARTGTTVLGDSISLRNYYEHLYHKMGVTKEQVRNSFSYYHSNPEQMSQFYQWIIDSLRQDVYELNGPRE
tara:strand:+ start:10498 stop:10860 length:363 start_codon:yes stop_codon:yes gene_type:complete